MCGAHSATLLRGRTDVAADLAKAHAAGHKLMFAEAADVYACRTCRSLFRDPADVPSDVTARYRDDEYGDRQLVRLHELSRAAHLADRAFLAAHGLEPGNRILEVGSYAGGLLAAAAALGCDAAGVDVGREVSAFARSLGYEVVTSELETGMFRPGSFDAVFILNCFEQIPDPVAALRESRRLVRPGGAIVLRTPDAAFVRGAHQPACQARARATGVLGVPFARCLSVRAVCSWLRGACFEPVAVRAGGRPWMDVAARAARPARAARDRRAGGQDLPAPT